MFARRTITTINEPMSETNSFVSEHRFVFGCSSEGEHKVRTYIGFGCFNIKIDPKGCPTFGNAPQI